MMRAQVLTSNTGAESISQANHDTSTTDADELDEVSPPLTALECHLVDLEAASRLLGHRTRRVIGLWRQN